MININSEKILTLFIVTFSVTALGFVVRACVFRVLHRWAERKNTRLDDLIIKTVKTPSILWCIGLGLYTGVELSEISLKYAIYITKIINILIIFSVTIVAAQLITKLISNYVERSSISIQSTGLLYTIIKIAIYVTGIIFIFHILGISIAPLITALGIGGLAVALALKDTLENLFAGIHIMAEKSIRVGDFVRLETGQEGYIEDISWRTTRIRMLPNNLLIIPNSKLAQSILINYHLPEKVMSLQIPISVGYSSEPEKVEKILIEEAKKASQEIEGMVSEFEPIVRFIPGFGENSLDFTLTVRIREFTEQYQVLHELRKRIFKRFKEEGIEIRGH